MSRQLNDLSPAMRQKAYELIARCAEEGMPVFIVDTLRTAAEHAENLKKGVSWTIHSKHLDGDAIDICPYHTYALHGPDKLQWDPEDPTWNRIGKIGESLGLRWGGRWKRKDLGHFELVRT